MRADTCKNCAWCVETTLSEVVKGHPVIVRHCHRYAPSNTDARWPKVDFSEWCGEFAMRCGLDEAV